MQLQKRSALCPTAKSAAVTKTAFAADCLWLSETAEPTCSVSLVSHAKHRTGVLCRLVDEMGQPIGPFRVWLQYAWIPGLAMSRALGDAVAHT